MKYFYSLIEILKSEAQDHDGATTRRNDYGEWNGDVVLGCFRWNETWLNGTEEVKGLWNDDVINVARETMGGWWQDVRRERL